MSIRGTQLKILTKSYGQRAQRSKAIKKTRSHDRMLRIRFNQKRMSMSSVMIDIDRRDHEEQSFD